MRNHMAWMLGVSLCVILILFLLPAFGFNGNNSLFFFIIVFFIAHLFMMGNHGGHRDHYGQDSDQENQSENKNAHATH